MSSNWKRYKASDNSVLIYANLEIQTYLHHGCAIIGDRLSAILIHHEQVTAIGTER